MRVIRRPLGRSLPMKHVPVGRLADARCGTRPGAPRLYTGLVLCSPPTAGGESVAFSSPLGL